MAGGQGTTGLGRCAATGGERGKAKIIGDAQLALEQQNLHFSHADNPQLVKELHGYQSPDTYCVTDSIMSLAVTLGKAGDVMVRPGRVLSVIIADAYSGG